MSAGRELAARQRGDVALADLTTLRLGGPARRLVETATPEEIVDAVRSADTAGEPVFVLGGGSNVVVADEGFGGTVVRILSRGVTVESCDSCSGAFVRIAAGEDWDGIVRRALAEGWIGVEALSGIPGLAGAAPIQNVGAYGQEIADTLARVLVWDRARSARRTLAAADCGFGYRTSVFKREPERYVVLEVALQLRLGDLGAPVRYAELARVLGVEVGDRVPAARVREAVLELRQGKGMVLDPADRDTWSAGSFFTNPIVPAPQAARLPAEAPRWPVEGSAGQGAGSAGQGADATGERVKLSAAWLIEHAGYGKGYGTGPARLSTKHTLALTNRGDATAADLLALAREIRDGVRERFGIELVNEPVLLGCAL